MTTKLAAILLVSGISHLAADSNLPVKTLLLPVATLEEQARARVSAKARITLASETSEAVKGVEPAIPFDKGHIPNYARALGSVENAPALFSKVFRTFVYEGTLRPETKLAMALRMSQLNGSPYTAAHVSRLLKATPEGKVVFDALRTNNLASLSEADRMALTYAEASTKEIHGLSDAEFRKVGGFYNDSQVVELTLNVCFFNYFTRLVEAINLPVEPWALEVPKVDTAKWSAPPARVALVSDAQHAMMTELDEAARKAPGNLGPEIANSMRAMVQVPAQAIAFRNYAFVQRPTDAVNRETKLQISFAVSMANGCRYCTLHQVLGLRKLGVDVNKLVAMKKNDEALTSRELKAVVFARKLTSNPSGITDADYDTIRAEFGERGSVEVVAWTCTFAFMNRFTDGLRLPSEDGAVQTYRETYGADFGK